MKKIKIASGETVIVDNEDYNRVVGFNSWYLARRNDKTPYAVFTQKVINGKQKNIYIHRFILGYNGRIKVVDHINGNILDNRKSNLRVCTSADNIKNSVISKRNTSGYKGVHIQKNRKKKYVASIRLDKKNIFLGRFETPEEAGAIYDAAAVCLFGEYARTNIKLGLI